MKKKLQKTVLGVDGLQHPLVEEDEYRKRLMQEARFKGCEIELRMIFDKYDRILRNCHNAKEAKDIGILGVMEVSALLDSKDVGVGGSLVVDGKVILSK